MTAFFDSWGYKRVTQIKQLITTWMDVIGADDNEAIDTYPKIRSFEQSIGSRRKSTVKRTWYPPGTASDDRHGSPVALLREKGIVGDAGGSRWIFSWGVMGFLMGPVDPCRLLCPIVFVVML